MSITFDNSQQTSRQIKVRDEDGLTRVIASVNCNLVPGRSLSFNLDVFDAAMVASNMGDVTDVIMKYMQEEFTKAQAQGLPVMPFVH